MAEGRSGRHLLAGVAPKGWGAPFDWARPEHFASTERTEILLAPGGRPAGTGTRLGVRLLSPSARGVRGSRASAVGGGGWGRRRSMGSLPRQSGGEVCSDVSVVRARGC